MTSRRMPAIAERHTECGERKVRNYKKISLFYFSLFFILPLYIFQNLYRFVITIDSNVNEIMRHKSYFQFSLFVIIINKSACQIIFRYDNDYFVLLFDVDIIFRFSFPNHFFLLDFCQIIYYTFSR